MGLGALGGGEVEKTLDAKKDVGAMLLSMSKLWSQGQRRLLFQAELWGVGVKVQAWVLDSASVGVALDLEGRKAPGMPAQSLDFRRLAPRSPEDFLGSAKGLLLDACQTLGKDPEFEFRRQQVEADRQKAMLSSVALAKKNRAGPARL